MDDMSGSSQDSMVITGVNAVKLQLQEHVLKRQKGHALARQTSQEDRLTLRRRYIDSERSKFGSTKLDESVYTWASELNSTNKKSDIVRWSGLKRGLGRVSINTELEATPSRTKSEPWNFPLSHEKAAEVHDYLKNSRYNKNTYDVNLMGVIRTMAEDNSVNNSINNSINKSQRLSTVSKTKIRRPKPVATKQASETQEKTTTLDSWKSPEWTFDGNLALDGLEDSTLVTLTAHNPPKSALYYPGEAGDHTRCDDETKTGSTRDIPTIWRQKNLPPDVKPVIKKNDSALRTLPDLHTKQSKTQKPRKKKGHKKLYSSSLPQIQLFVNASDAKIAAIKVEPFNEPPKPHPNKVIFHMPTTAQTTHHEVHEAAVKSLRYTGRGKVIDIKFVPRNVVLGTYGMEDRWIVTFDSMKSAEHVTLHGLWLDGDYIYVEPYDRVLLADYHMWLKLEELREKKMKAAMKLGKTNISIVS